MRISSGVGRTTALPVLFVVLLAFASTCIHAASVLMLPSHYEINVASEGRLGISGTTGLNGALPTILIDNVTEVVGRAGVVIATDRTDGVLAFDLTKMLQSDANADRVLIDLDGIECRGNGNRISIVVLGFPLRNVMVNVSIVNSRMTNCTFTYDGEATVGPVQQRSFLEVSGTKFTGSWYGTVAATTGMISLLHSRFEEVLLLKNNVTIVSTNTSMPANPETQHLAAVVVGAPLDAKMLFIDDNTIHIQAVRLQPLAGIYLLGSAGDDGGAFSVSNPTSFSRNLIQLDEVDAAIDSSYTAGIKWQNLTIRGTGLGWQFVLAGNNVTIKVATSSTNTGLLAGHAIGFDFHAVMLHVQHGALVTIVGNRIGIVAHVVVIGVRQLNVNVSLTDGARWYFASNVVEAESTIAAALGVERNAGSLAVLRGSKHELQNNTFHVRIGIINKQVEYPGVFRFFNTQTRVENDSRYLDSTSRLAELNMPFTITYAVMVYSHQNHIVNVSHHSTFTVDRMHLVDGQFSGSVFSFIRCAINVLDSSMLTTIRANITAFSSKAALNGVYIVESSINVQNRSSFVFFDRSSINLKASGPDVVRASRTTVDVSHSSFMGWLKDTVVVVEGYRRLKAYGVHCASGNAIVSAHSVHAFVYRSQVNIQCDGAVAAAEVASSQLRAFDGSAFIVAANSTLVVFGEQSTVRAIQFTHAEIVVQQQSALLVVNNALDASNTGNYEVEALGVDGLKPMRFLDGSYCFVVGNALTANGSKALPLETAGFVLADASGFILSSNTLVSTGAPSPTTCTSFASGISGGAPSVATVDRDSEMIISDNIYSCDIGINLHSSSAAVAGFTWETSGNQNGWIAVVNNTSTGQLMELGTSGKIVIRNNSRCTIASNTVYSDQSYAAVLPVDRALMSSTDAVDARFFIEGRSNVVFQCNRYRDRNPTPVTRIMYADRSYMNLSLSSSDGKTLSDLFAACAAPCHLWSTCSTIGTNHTVPNASFSFSEEQCVCQHCTNDAYGGPLCTRRPERNTSALLQQLDQQHVSAIEVIASETSTLASASYTGTPEPTTSHVSTVTKSMVPAPITALSNATVPPTGTQAPNGTSSPAPSQQPTSAPVSTAMPQSATSAVDPPTQSRRYSETRTAGIFSSVTVDQGAPGDGDPQSLASVAAIAGILTPRAAEAVVGASTAATAVTAVIASPAAAGQAVRVGLIAGSIDCIFTEDSPTPSLFEHPIQVDVGGGAMASYAGSTLATLTVYVVIIVSAGVGYVLGPRDDSLHGKVHRVVMSTAAALVVAYFSPILAQSGVLLLAHQPNANEAAVGAVSLLVVISVTGFIAAIVIRQYSGHVIAKSQPGKTSLEFVPAASSSVNFLNTFRHYFDAARSEQLIIRCYFLEELVVSELLGIVSGIQPRSEGCLGIALAQSIVCGLHLMYMIMFRPYAGKLEQLFVILGATVLTGLAVIAVIITSSHTAISSLRRAFGILAFVESGVFFLQMVVLGMWAYTVRQRRAVRRRAALFEKEAGDSVGANTASSAEDEKYEQPLLSVAAREAQEAGHPAVNPLTSA